MTKAGDILVVDDEEVIRELLTDILEEEGFVVRSVPNAMQALELLKNKDEFIILFTDIMMPEMDGIELVREARKLAPSLIPIVMTGFATLETARAAVREGAYEYVLKPFSLSEIKLAVHNALERHTLISENTRLREVTELFNISERIASIYREQELLNFVLKAALERVGAERGSIMVTTDDGQFLEVSASIGIPEEDTKTIVSIGQGISGRVAAQRVPLLVTDLTSNPEVKEYSRHLKANSFVSVPLERRHSANRRQKINSGQMPDVLAVLNVTEKASGDPFTESDLKLLSIMANHASAALENARLIEDIETAHLSTLQSMALILEAKDPYTHGHSARVRNYSVMAARKLGMAQEDVRTLSLGAALHDLGKIGVKDAILNSVKALTNDEWDSIKLHPVIGYDVLEPVDFLTPEHLSLVRSHHERLDGSGYPDGLAGSDLSEMVRIIGVADTYDAMSSNRAYRQEMDPAKIAAELRRCGGDLLEPQVANMFVELIESGDIARYANLDLTEAPEEV